MISLFEHEAPAAAIRNSLHYPGPHLVQSRRSQRTIFLRLIIWIVTVSSHNVEFIKQIKDKICLNETSKQGFQVPF